MTDSVLQFAACPARLFESMVEQSTCGNTYRNCICHRNRTSQHVEYAGETGFCLAVG